jgi:hypothetical protein
MCTRHLASGSIVLTTSILMHRKGRPKGAYIGCTYMISFHYWNPPHIYTYPTYPTYLSAHSLSRVLLLLLHVLLLPA